MIPSVLKNWNCSIDGIGYAGLCEEAQLPDIKFKMEEHRGGGMDAPYEIEMGQEVMSAKLTFAEYPADVIKNLNAGRRIQLRGALVNDQTRVTIPVLVELGGRTKGFMAGSWKAGDMNKPEFEIAVDYFRWNQAGADLLVIDVPNMVRVVGGVDQLAAQRAALGR
jgi:hypothetical protein